MKETTPSDSSPLENNRIIAEFMGVHYDKTEPVMKVWLEDHDSLLFYCEWHPEYGRGTNRLAWDFAPQRNWCQLMPVWTKFRDMKFTDEFVKTLHANYCARAAHEMAWNGIKSTYKVLSNAVKWYNSLTLLQQETV